MKTKHLFILLLLTLACVNQVQAHAVITESSLNISSVSPRKSSLIELTFNSKVVLSLSQIFLVSKGDIKQFLYAKPGDRPGHVVISLPALNSGEYALQLKVLAADGHLNEDLIRFIVPESHK